MCNNALRLFVMIFLTPAVGAGNYAPSQLPMPQHYVEDYANVVRPDHEHALNGLLQELERKTGVQYIVLTVPTTSGIPIDKYSLELAGTTWKLGQQGKDNGMLFVIAVSDRKYRFTPGLGLEGFLTESYLGGLGEKTLVPRLRQNQYSKGIHAVNVEVIRRIASQMGVTLAGLPGIPQASPDHGMSQRPSQPVHRQPVGGHGTSQRMGLPCCSLLFLLLPVLLIGGLGAGRYGGTGGAFFPMMFHGFGGYHRHGPFGGGPFGGGFGGFGGTMGNRFGGSTGGGFGHFRGGGGGRFSGRGAGGSW